MQTSDFSRPLKCFALGKGFFSPFERRYEVPLQLRYNGPVLFTTQTRSHDLHEALVPVVDPRAQIDLLELTQKFVVGVSHRNELNPRARFDNGWVRREKHDLEVRAITHQQLIAEDYHL